MTPDIAKIKELALAERDSGGAEGYWAGLVLQVIDALVTQEMRAHYEAQAERHFLEAKIARLELQHKDG